MCQTTALNDIYIYLDPILNLLISDSVEVFSDSVEVFSDSVEVLEPVEVI